MYELVILVNQIVIFCGTLPLLSLFVVVIIIVTLLWQCSKI